MSGPSILSGNWAPFTQSITMNIDGLLHSVPALNITLHQTRISSIQKLIVAKLGIRKSAVPVR
jgi:hypothetical protein